jgi:hypothetical protein
MRKECSTNLARFARQLEFVETGDDVERLGIVIRRELKLAIARSEYQSPDVVFCVGEELVLNGRRENESTHPLRIIWSPNEVL